MIIDENTRIYCADIEANGLLIKEKDKEAATRIWCLSFCDTKDGVIKSITDINIIKKFFEQENAVVVMHYGVMYDIPLLEKLFNFKVKTQIIDTLPLSQTLFPQRLDHNLENWGKTLGIEKLPIIDWNNEKLLLQYVLRCESDIKIQTALWKEIRGMLNNLYDNNEDKWRYCEYLTFKYQCVQKQSELGVKLDIPLIKQTLMELEDLKIQKIEALTAAMPKQPIKSIKKYPKVFRKADGGLSANGQKWTLLLQEKGLPENHQEDIEVITGYNDGNPNSHTQIKSWLDSLGWIPDYFKYVKEEGKSEMRKIPQVASKDEPGELSISVKKLIEKEPKLEELSSLGIISHRISIFKNFLANQRDGRIYQGISGLTNTLRLMHNGIVNLPSSNKPFSENVRASLIPDEGMVMCGTDLQGIEDNTKRHYIYKYDPEYVEEMKVPGYCAHLEMGLLAGLLTQEQVDFYKWYDKEKDTGKKDFTEDEKNQYKSIKEIRHNSKTVNFSATYKVGKATLSRNSGLSLKESAKLLEIYWIRNKAILDIENDLQIKTINGQMWLLNPVSKFWYSLRAEKDKFSTLNQGTAVYTFDLYVKNMNKLGVYPNFQVHDEASFNIMLENKEKTKELLQLAIQKVNEELKLNVTIGASVDYGYTYKDCH